jgi:hypothetical protein
LQANKLQAVTGNQTSTGHVRAWGHVFVTPDVSIDSWSNLLPKNKFQKQKKAEISSILQPKLVQLLRISVCVRGFEATRNGALVPASKVPESVF